MDHKAPPRRKRPQSDCAFCKTPFTKDNDSREHLIPNAIGGRRAVARFICKSCNDKRGATWDRALTDQLKSLCTLLNIKRDRGSVRPLRVQTVTGETLQLHADGHLTLPHTIVTQQRTADQIAIQIKAPSTKEFKKAVRGLARKYPQLDVTTALQEATAARKYNTNPWHIPLHLGGVEAGRSIIKSLVALAACAGIDLTDLEHAQEYLFSDGEPCFGYCNDVDVVVNRPDGMFFHCVGISGDPETKQILGYVEYFGCLRIVACLSSTYEGESFQSCYAIDPVRGTELDLQIELAFSPEEIRAIYEYLRVDYSVQRDAVGRLLAYWSKKDAEAALARAVDDAVEYARAEFGVTESENMSEEQAWVFAEMFAERIRPTLEHLVRGRRFTPDQMKRILQMIRDEEGDEN